MVGKRTNFDKAVRIFEVYSRFKGLAAGTLETYNCALRQLRGSLDHECSSQALPPRKRRSTPGPIADEDNFA